MVRKRETKHEQTTQQIKSIDYALNFQPLYLILEIIMKQSLTYSTGYWMSNLSADD